MNKYIKAFVLSIIGFTGFAQDELKLPNITPPSPEASAMTKYSDVTVNEFTGMVFKSIPIYNYQAGNLQLPISLDYSGAGVKVDDLPTWVGINWTLNAGGVITRSVRDIADESAVTRYFFSDQEVVNYNNTTDGTSNGEFLRNLVYNTQIDSEVDVFQFNFSGYSGSFYLDDNWNGVLLKNDTPLKIRVGSRNDFYNSKIITITTPDGVMYTFGGSNATEETSRRTVVNGTMQPQDTVEGTTAFYLTSIEHPIYGEIRFDYLQLDQEIVVSQKIQKKSKIIQYDDLGNCITFEGSNSPICSNNASLEDKSSLITISTRVLNPKYLSRIYSYNHLEEIRFSSEAIDNIYFKRVLNNIVVDNNSNVGDGHLKKVDLTYLGRVSNSNSGFGHQDSSKRFFLHKITFNGDVLYAQNGQDGRRNEVFEFDYNNYDSLPARFSYSQDYGGYFNGKDNLSGLPNDPFFNPTNNIYYADRTPDFNYAVYGSLSRITYPTGGSTVFEYESPKFKKEVTESIALTTYRNQSNMVLTNNLIDGVPKVIDNGDVNGDGEPDLVTIFDEPMLKTETVKITVHAKAYLSNQFPTFFPQQEKVTLRFTDKSVTPNIVTDKVIAFTTPSGPNNEGYISKTAQYSFLFEQGKKYKVELIIEAAEGDNTAVPMEAWATFEYFKGYAPTDGLGVRLKRHTNYAKNDTPEEIKRYYYNEIDKINPAIEDLPLFTNGSYKKTEKEIFNFICNPNPACGEVVSVSFVEIWYWWENLYSDRYMPNSSYGQSYDAVTVSYGGDNFENGGVEKTFSRFSDYGLNRIKTLPGLYPRSVVQSLNLVGDYPDFFQDYSMPSNLNGTLIKEKKYKLDSSNALKKYEEVSLDYDFSTESRINSIVSKKEFDALQFNSPVSVNNTASNYSIGNLMIESKRSELTYKQVINFIEPVPVGAQDESIYKKIVTTEHYEYGTLRGLPTRVLSSTSENSILNIVQNYYVNQVGSLSGLSSSQIGAVNTLENKYIISKPIQTEQYQNSEKLMSIRTLYKNIGTNVNFPKIVPDIIQAKKGDIAGLPFENRVKFLEYDGYGRPSIVSLENGSKTKYFYNNLGQVTMKIENYIPLNGGSGEEFSGEDVAANQNPCSYHVEFPNSLVYVYKYNYQTNKLTEIHDPNCDVTYYEYDALQRLKFIKDDEGNILQEFDSSFKRF